MKLRTIKITLFASIIGMLLTNCEKDSPCECKGKYRLANSTAPGYFYATTELDCDTNEPVGYLHGDPNNLFFGCVD